MGAILIRNGWLWLQSKLIRLKLTALARSKPKELNKAG